MRPDVPLYQVGGAQTGHECGASCFHGTPKRIRPLPPGYFKICVQHGLPDRDFIPALDLLCGWGMPHAVIEVRSHLAFVFVIGYWDALRWFTLHRKRLRATSHPMRVYWYDESLATQPFLNNADLLLTAERDPWLDAVLGPQVPPPAVIPDPAGAAASPNWAGPLVVPRVIPEPDCALLMLAAVQCMGGEPLLQPPRSTIYGRWSIFDIRDFRWRVGATRFLRVAYNAAAPAYDGFRRPLDVRMDIAFNPTDARLERQMHDILTIAPEEPAETGWED
jgi:hypothetical protein